MACDLCDIAELGRARVTSVAPDRDASVPANDLPTHTPMQTELAPVRRAGQLMQAGDAVADVVDDLRRGFGLSVTDAVAAVAAYVALTRSGMEIPEEPFARPFV